MINTYKILCFSLFVAFLFNSEPFSEYKEDKNYFITKSVSDIAIDGLMTEDIWSKVPILNDYTQEFPYNGEMSSLKTEVRMFYDDKGIYLYARMYDDRPDQIQKRLSKRDDLENGFWESSDWIMFSFDSRHDHQTGYLFAINCSGVKADAMIYDDADYDIEYNSLWYAQTNIDNLGWTVEMYLPFSSFKFDSEMSELWGFNSKRYIYRLNEIDSWVSFPLETKGLSSKFGHLIGFSGISDYKKVELKPFLGFERTLEKDSKLSKDLYGYINDGDSILHSENTLENNNVGFDLKYNLNTRSSVNLSINPDFGQVEVDPADINISYYETYLNEKRPFFIENSSMFSLPIEMFYSRRIGDLKNVSYNIEVPTYIDVAAKFSGKEFNGLSYGLIGALTNNSYPDSLSFNPEIPHDNRYYAFRIKQDLLDGNSFIGFFATTFEGLRGNYKISKDEEGVPILNQYELENSFFKSSTYSIDGVFNFLDNRLYADVQFAYSKTNESGYAYSVESIYDFNRFWSFSLDLENIDENFDNNDLGYIYRNDIKSQKFEIKYQDLEPNKNFQEKSASIKIIKGQNSSDNLKLNNSILLNLGALLKDNSYLSLGFSRYYDAYDDRLLYDYKEHELGVAMFIPSGYGSYINWNSDNRLINAFSFGLGWGKNKIDDWGYNLQYKHVYRPDYNIKLSFNYEYYKSKEKYHWLDIVQISDMPHYIFSNANNELQKFIIRFDAFLNEKITLQNYTELIQTNNRFSNWSKLDIENESNIYPYDFNNLIGGSSLYAPEGENPTDMNYVNPNNDVYFFSKYSELIYNLVLKWEISPEAELYFIYTRYWLVNGKKFNSFFNFLNYSEDNPWVESSFDHGISVKYSRQFNL